MTIKIKFDAGHGGKDSGAIGHGMMEKDLVLAITKKTMQYLDGYDVEVSATRLTDKYLTLDERTDMANRDKVDYLVSVHINAGGGEGFETFIHNGLSDSTNTSKLRTVVHRNIIKTIGGKDRGRKKANFHMLRESKMSAILIEFLFIDNYADAQKLSKSSFIDKCARGLANGLIEAHGLKKNKTTVINRVVTGSFADYENAERRVKELAKAGFKSFIDTVKK